MGIKQNSWLGLGYHKLCLVVGIGHAGTLISAVLLLFRQRGEWQLTLLKRRYFSVIQAGLFPIIHMGRPWLAYCTIPNQFGLFG
jgi:molybdopterin-containing oxidoreductase family membrane subunit